MRGAPAPRRLRIPVVLTRGDVAALLGQLRDTTRLMAALLYGSGLRLNEMLRLRVQELDFERGRITVREGNGDKDRLTMLPAALQPRCSNPAWGPPARSTGCRPMPPADLDSLAPRSANRGMDRGTAAFRGSIHRTGTDICGRSVGIIKGSSH